MSDANGNPRSYKDLVAWQRAMTLAETVYSATKGFPRDEIYGLTSQMRRSAVSIASNIAEGNSRQTRGEYLQFVGHARGSLAELHTQAILAQRLGLISPGIGETLFSQLDELGRILGALRTSLSKPVRRTSSS